MAQKISVLLVDDLDGSDAAETVRFGLDGVSYEIDLSEKNAKALREALADYVGSRSTYWGAISARSARSGSTAAEIRAWARDNGWDVPDRGRVSAEVRAAFEAAH